VINEREWEWGKTLPVYFPHGDIPTSKLACSPLLSHHPHSFIPFGFKQSLPTGFMKLFLYPPYRIFNKNIRPNPALMVTVLVSLQPFSRQIQTMGHYVECKMAKVWNSSFLLIITLKYRSRDNSVNNATVWTTRVRFPEGEKYLSSAFFPNRIWSPSILLCNGYRRRLPQG
jgi:hypothetical protein